MKPRYGLARFLQRMAANNGAYVERIEGSAAVVLSIVIPKREGGK